MADAVEKAMQERKHLIVEAGTGTGKTLAYLLPVIRSGEPRLHGIPDRMSQFRQTIDRAGKIG